MKKLIIILTLILTTFSCKSQQNKTNINESFDFSKNIVSEKETQKLKDIRDSYIAINGLEELYVDKTHTNGLPYHIYVPKKLKKGKKYPLVIFLHGSTDLTIDTHKGFPKGVWSLPFVQEKHPHILLVPRGRTIDDLWHQINYRKMVIEAIDDLIIETNKNIETPNIDISRLYLTGFSLGGMGTWSYIKKFPNKFAAAAPLSGFYSGPTNIEEAMKIKHIPIWIFNGDSDGGVGGSRQSYELLVDVNAKDVLYHEYKNQKHVIDDFAYFTPGFMEWLFKQKLKK